MARMFLTVRLFAFCMWVCRIKHILRPLGLWRDMGRASVSMRPIVLAGVFGFISSGRPLMCTASSTRGKGWNEVWHV